MKRKVWLWLGETLVSEIVGWGLYFIALVLLRYDYFGMEYMFLNVYNKVIDEAGLKTAGYLAEISAVKGGLVQIFPFNYMFGTTDPTAILFMGIIMTIAGMAIMIITTRSKGHFVKDLGSIIMLPGIIGIICMFVLQAITALLMVDVIRQGVSDAQYIHLIQVSGLTLWARMGSLLIIGIWVMMFGVLIGYVIYTKGNKPFIVYAIARGMRYMGAFLLIYYGFMRLFATSIFATSEIGRIMRVFAFSSEISSELIVISSIMFTIGYVIHSYGKYMIRKEIRDAKIQYQRQQGQYQQQGFLYNY